MSEGRGAAFELAAAQLAAEQWGMNCGPGAIAGVLGLTPTEVRPHMGDFERKGYTNPALMWSALRSLGVEFSVQGGHGHRENWPAFGLARVQWEGPWTKSGVPARAAYRHTHWVGTRGREHVEIFDINCICVGGWVPVSEWVGEVVPWLLRETTPKASGRWHITHAVEISPPRQEPEGEADRGRG